VTRHGSRVVEAATLSKAWLETVELVVAAQQRKLFHTFTRIEQPLVEDPGIRRKCDLLLDHLGHPSVETVAGTIFPVPIAAGSKGPTELVERYRRTYPTLRRFNGNHHGTYFGRLIAYPGADGDVDQLVPLIEKLRRESVLNGPKSARYEVGVAAPEDLVPLEAAAAAEIHVAGHDNSAMGFPCLSACSFQLDHGSVHLLAHYRYEFLIERGYGNYLGLARLLEYVSSSAGLSTGQITIITGRAHVEPSAETIRGHLYPTLFDEA
jgi:hypothetical protein